jgi:hypothetical protein
MYKSTDLSTHLIIFDNNIFQYMFLIENQILFMINGHKPNRTLGIYIIKFSYYPEGW